MASGTQGYSKTTTDKSLADTLLSEYKKLRKRAKAGGSDEPLDPANIKFVQDSVQAVDDFIITGINGINSMFTSATAVDDFNPVSYDDGSAIDVEIVTENKKQTALLEQQNTLLGAFIDLKTDVVADSKRLRQEQRMEDEEFLSGTQGFRKRKEDKKGGGGGGGGLFGAIDAITDTVQLVQMFRKGRWLSKLTNLGKGFNFRSPFSKASKATNLNKTQNLLPSSSSIPFKPSGTTTGLGVNADMGKVFNTTAVEVGKSGSSVNKVNTILDTSTNLNKVVNNGSSASKIVNNSSALTKVSGDANKLTKITEGSKGLKLLNSTPVKYAIPGLSLFSGVSNMAQGNFAEGGLDLADAGVDTAIATGAMSSTTGAGAVLGPAIAVTGAGLVSGWLGELTRGTDDWIRGDGTNTAKNIAGDVTAGLSGALETVGAPFTALFAGVDSLIKTGGFEESNKKMAEVDTNLREGFRKFLNVWDPMNVISDEVGGFGTLRLYGKENQENAKEQLLKDKGIITDDSTTNGDQANAFSAENILGGDGVEVASTDLTGLVGDTTNNNLSKVNGQNFFQTSNSTTTGNLKGLTEDDYKWLAYAISGEAAQGTDDVYGVAASILNRKARGDGSIEEIIKAPGQYEAFEKGTMVDSPEIQSLLQSEEGQAKLMEALRVLKGRTDFKGQSQLGNRVATEDPMFDKKGNFFHHSWQTSGDSVKPEGWKPANWQQYMPGEGIEGAQGLNNKLSQQVAGLSSETSGTPNVIVISSPTNTASTSGSNDGGTHINTSQLPIKNEQMLAYATMSLQALNV
tara:strand:- start:1438 stop:3828 length:2391 start_codon:yes stop_codon:yes gene_type:complete